MSEHSNFYPRRWLNYSTGLVFRVYFLSLNGVKASKKFI
jgi:hypothetical protein